MNNIQIAITFAVISAKVLSDPITSAEIEFYEKNGIKWEFEIQKNKGK